jgi:phage terminase large subunit-like protein
MTEVDGDLFGVAGLRSQAFTSGFDRKTAGFSPGRVDALVWCMSDLMLAPPRSFPPSIENP